MKKLLLFLMMLLSTNLYAGGTPKDGVIIISSDNKVMLDELADQSFIPASVVKVLTAYLAMNHWSPDHKFKTNIYHNNNNIYVKGSGDPYLVTEDMIAIVDMISREGIDSIDNIYLDNSLFSDKFTLPGNDQSVKSYNATPSAVAMNFNSFKVTRENGELISHKDPDLPVVEFAKHLATSIKGGVGSRLNLGQDPEGNLIYFGQVLEAMLVRKGIHVNGGILFDVTPNDIDPLFTYTNPKPLEQSVKAMLKWSNNFIANQLVILLAIEHNNRPVSRKDVADYLMFQLAKDFHWKDFNIVDGSGLSRKNRLSARQLGDVLIAMRDVKHVFPDKYGVGVAKTGTMSGVRTIGGFFGGTDDVFVIMANRNIKRKKSTKGLYKLWKRKYR